MNGYVIAISIMLVMFVGLMIRLVQEPVEEPESAVSARRRRAPIEPVADSTSPHTVSPAVIAPPNSVEAVPWPLAEAAEMTDEPRDSDVAVKSLDSNPETTSSHRIETPNDRVAPSATDTPVVAEPVDVSDLYEPAVEVRVIDSDKPDDGTPAITPESDAESRPEPGPPPTDD